MTTLGYVAQIKGYAHSEGATKFDWLAMDKQNGHLTYLMYDSEDTQPRCMTSSLTVSRTGLTT